MKVLKNARLIDGTGASPVNDATIVIDRNRITEVTARNQGDVPADSEIIDGWACAAAPPPPLAGDNSAKLARRWT
jgi:imidazolonepropionase-like amidohydrolase